MLGTVASRVADAIILECGRRALKDNACDQKNDPTIFLSSGEHTKPKLKLTLTLALARTRCYLVSSDVSGRDWSEFQIKTYVGIF